jgi:16S rRNA (guanine527-N7)-methyltransferase
MARLEFLLRRSGLRPDRSQLDQLWKFHNLLRQRNEELDLTRLHSFDNMVLKLYVDSALVGTLLRLPSPLLDLGSGPGFPGVPLKIFHPDLQVILGEPRAKRVTFLREVIEALHLTDVDVEPRRIGKRFRHAVQGVITRAVEDMSETLQRVLPWLEPGAQAVFMKGPGCDDELETAQTFFADDFRLALDRSYQIPETPHARRLLVFERLDTVRPIVSTPRPRIGAGSSPSVTRVTTSQSTEWKNHRMIDSADNETFKLLRGLQTARGIRKSGLALVGGVRYIQEILEDHADSAVAWVTCGPPAPPPDAPAHLEWYQLKPQLFREIDSVGTGPPQLLIRVPEIAAWSDADWVPGCTLFVPFQDPENVGAVLRSAVAFGVTRVVLLREAAHPFHPRSLRAAGGSALLRTQLLQGPALADLHVSGAPLYALSADGSDVGSFTFPEQFGLLPGLEGPGIPPALRGPQALRVPMQPGQESLNAATATAIVLYLWSSRS